MNGAAQESNLPSVGLRRRTGFEVERGSLDFVQRDFTAPRPNELWVADLSYQTESDRFSRKPQRALPRRDSLTSTLFPSYVKTIVAVRVPDTVPLT
jgi:hypothetical protein